MLTLCNLPRMCHLPTHIYRGEAKFEELTVIFAPPPCAMNDTSNDEGWHYDMDSLLALEYGPPAGDDMSIDNVATDQPMDLPMDDANPQIQPLDTIYVEPIDAMPLQVIPPLDLIEISSSSSHSSQVN